MNCTVVALSYRGFWTSRGRASQRGIELDAAAALQWVLGNHDFSNTNLVLWGQSIGCGVATNAAARYLSSPNHHRTPKPPITALILETPFVSVRSMLVALYPQKWLPYRYLWPFLWNFWDSEEALSKIAGVVDASELPQLLVVQAERDEVVPAEQPEILKDHCAKLGFRLQHRLIPGALHHEAMAKLEGRAAVVEFLRRLSRS